MMNTAERAKTLASYCQTTDIETYLGYFAAVDLVQWVTLELGHPDILDGFVEIHPDQKSKALPNGPILHILSGNSPHAGLQSLLRGILIGAENIIKLPSSGSQVIENWIDNLPTELESLVKVIPTTEELTDEIFNQCKTVIAIGSDQTMRSIQTRIQPHQQFIPHGHKLSIGIIDQPSKQAAELAVKDICASNQQGCLSLHTIYVKENAAEFAPILAEAMQQYELAHPRGEISLSESGVISNLRETIRYEAANSPETYALYESEDNTSWTVIYKNSAALSPSPLNRVVTVQPWPSDFSELGAESQFLSTVAVHPDNLIDQIDANIPRISKLGYSQKPPLQWHHDGISPLSSLIRWRDIHH